MQTQAISLVHKALPGAMDHGQGVVTFALYAPGKSSVGLGGNFNNWDFRGNPLHDRGGGFWVTQEMLEPGTYEYQFLVDDVLVCDPYAQGVIWRQDGAVPAATVEIGHELYIWRHDDWQRPSFRDLLIYELHVGDFSPKGNFQGVIDKLDYLRELGINAIELMPIYEPARHDYWGYEPLYFMAVRHSYGTRLDMFKLVDEAHARGIAIILDLVLAHTGKEHPFNSLYPYLQSPWYGRSLGEIDQFGLPMLDFTKDATNAFVRDVQAYWLRVCHVDGFRYDYLAGIGKLQDKGLPYLIRSACDIRPEAYLIGECIPENPDLVNDSGLSGVWHTRSRLALASLLLQEDIVPYHWQDFEDTIRALDWTTQGYRQPTFMVQYLESHDDRRLIEVLKQRGFSDYDANQRSALAITVLMTIPGEPMLYHGQEFGQRSPKTTGPNPLQWALLENEGKGLQEHYARMCNLRRRRTALRGGSFSFEAIYPPQRCAVYLRRYGEADLVLVAVNFSTQVQKVTIPFGDRGKWWDFYAQDLLAVPERMEVEIEPFASRIYYQSL